MNTRNTRNTIEIAVKDCFGEIISTTVVKGDCDETITVPGEKIVISVRQSDTAISTSSADVAAETTTDVPAPEALIIDESVSGISPTPEVEIETQVVGAIVDTHAPVVDDSAETTPVADASVADEVMTEPVDDWDNLVERKRASLADVISEASVADAVAPDASVTDTLIGPFDDVAAAETNIDAPTPDVVTGDISAPVAEPVPIADGVIDVPTPETIIVEVPTQAVELMDEAAPTPDVVVGDASAVEEGSVETPTAETAAPAPAVVDEVVVGAPGSDEVVPESTVVDVQVMSEMSVPDVTVAETPINDEVVTDMPAVDGVITEAPDAPVVADEVSVPDDVVVDEISSVADDVITDVPDAPIVDEVAPEVTTDAPVPDEVISEEPTTDAVASVITDTDDATTGQADSATVVDPTSVATTTDQTTATVKCTITAPDGVLIVSGSTADGNGFVMKNLGHPTDPSPALSVAGGCKSVDVIIIDNLPDGTYNVLCGCNDADGRINLIRCDSNLNLLAAVRVSEHQSPVTSLVKWMNEFMIGAVYRAQLNGDVVPIIIRINNDFTASNAIVLNLNKPDSYVTEPGDVSVGVISECVTTDTEMVVVGTVRNSSQSYGFVATIDDTFKPLRTCTLDGGVEPFTAIQSVIVQGDKLVIRGTCHGVGQLAVSFVKLLDMELNAIPDQTVDVATTDTAMSDPAQTAVGSAVDTTSATEPTIAAPESETPIVADDVISDVPAADVSAPDVSVADNVVSEVPVADNDAVVAEVSVDDQPVVDAVDADSTVSDMNAQPDQVTSTDTEAAPDPNQTNPAVQ